MVKVDDRQQYRSEGSVLLPFLWMRVTVASLHSCGIVQRLKELFKGLLGTEQVNWLPLSVGELVCHHSPGSLTGPG